MDDRQGDDGGFPPPGYMIPLYLRRPCRLIQAACHLAVYTLIGLCLWPLGAVWIGRADRQPVLAWIGLGVLVALYGIGVLEPCWRQGDVLPWQARVGLAAGNLLFTFAVAAVVTGLGAMLMLSLQL